MVAGVLCDLGVLGVQMLLADVFRAELRPSPTLFLRALPLHGVDRDW